MMANKKKQSGIALITVLMILAIMVTVASTMTGRLTLSLKRTEGLIFSQKVYWYGQAAADLGRMILNQDFADSDVVSLDQIWATPDMVFPLENGNLAGQIKDQRSCFNVNAVGLADQGNTPAIPVTQFQYLLEAIGLNDYSAEMIAQSTRDWIDKDSKSDAAQGAEDSFYQSRSVAHLAANSLMVDISELRAVQGVGQKTYEKIAPYLCALPSVDQTINVNTVGIEQPEILYALFKKEHSLSVSDFRKLLEDRPTSGWNSVSAFLANGLFNGLPVSAALKKQLSVSSDFFQLNGIVEFEERLRIVNILFQIEAKKAKVIRYQSGGFK
ncbi:MAG: general secretion pathway protein K [Psychromonas sp.]|jgi:general secretion pathway protein K|uniref:type II secretion system minor pseudopilin GspK n=1 Tax=Psychromonas sp. TaxID=1884585 RepID=UPI0039E48036